MGENSKIEWTDHTFNPWVGCQKVGPGCANCYAEREMTRKTRWANAWGPPETSERIRTTAAYWRKPIVWNRKAEANGATPKVFCGSLCDVFEDNPLVEEWRNDLCDLIIQTPNLVWLVLTKRPHVALRYTSGNWPANARAGTSIENQQTADERIPLLLRIPAPICFLSIEPMLDEISLAPFLYHNQGYGWRRAEKESINWVIVGGESGPNARPMNPDWARSIRDQCREAGVPFFMKQMSRKAPIPDDLMIREFPA